MICKDLFSLDNSNFALAVGRTGCEFLRMAIADSVYNINQYYIMTEKLIVKIKEKVKENLSAGIQKSSGQETQKVVSAPLIVMTNEQLEEHSQHLVDGVIEAFITVFGLADKKEQLISKREAMKRMGKCSTTLYLWAKNGYLKPVKVGNRVMYHAKDIDSIIQNEE